MSDWLEAEQRVERAQQLSESACWDEALIELDIAISINPHNSLWHAQRGFLLEELDRYAEAAEAYERSLHIEPGDCDVAMALANVLLREGRFHRAVVVLEGVTKLDSSFEPAYCHRIRAYAELGLHDKAEEMFYVAQELDDQCPNCFFFLAGSLAARGQFPRAIYCWHRTLELAPDYEGVYRRIGQAYQTLGSLRRARAYFLHELRDDPGNVDLLFELAEVALASGQPRRAAAKFEQILELDPLHLQARLALGKVLLATGKPAGALKCFEKLEANQPECAETPDFNLYTAQAFFGLGDFDDAAGRAKQAVDLDPSNAAAWALLGECYLKLRRTADAADCLARVNASDPSNPDANHKLGVCLCKLGQPAAAIPHFSAALQARPDSDEVKCAAAQAHLDLHQWAQARRVLATAGGDEARRLRKAVWKGQVGALLHWR